MSDKQVHLADFLKTGRMPAPDAETEETLPATNAEYKPFSRRSNKPEFSLHFITAAGTIRSVQYAHLDSGSSYTAECLTLRFMGMEPLKVVIHGRMLRDLYDFIHQHRIVYVREAARGHAADDEPIVTKVTITAVEEMSITPVTIDGKA